MTFYHFTKVMGGDEIPFVQNADHLLTVLSEQIAMAKGNVILLVTPVHLCELDGLTHCMFHFSGHLCAR